MVDRTATVMLVDDHPLFLNGLAVALRAEQDFEIVGEAYSAAEALALLRDIAIDIAVLDIMMPDVSGITLAAEVHVLQPSCAILGLSVIDDPGIVADMLRAHASGYALKTQRVPEIVAAMRAVLAGERYLPPTISHEAICAELEAPAMQPLERLTRREREIYELLIRGYSNDEIAARLFIARRTVETHRHRIMRKLSAHSIAQMQRLAARYGGLAT